MPSNWERYGIAQHQEIKDIGSACGSAIDSSFSEAKASSVIPFPSLLDLMAWAELNASGPVSVLVEHITDGILLVDVYVWSYDSGTQKYQLTHSSRRS